MEIVRNLIDIWSIGTFPQNLAWIRLAVSEKTGVTHGRWTKDNNIST